MDHLYKEFETIRDNYVRLPETNSLNTLKNVYSEHSKLVHSIMDYFIKLIKKNIHKPIDIVVEIIQVRIAFYELDENKQTILRCKEIVFDYFIENHIFNELYDSFTQTDLSNETQTDASFIPRINQIEAFKLIDKKIETGIHCQATGCGKSYIILYYIQSIQNKFGNNSNTILFTERIDILRDMFGLDNDIVHHNKIQQWKKMGIVDLTNTKIINAVTNKNRNWVNEFDDTQPCLLLINRSYLTTSDYKHLEKIHLILHDECHNTPSINCYDFLSFMKRNEVPIVGFSATPLRSGLNEIAKIKHIYSVNNQINLLTDYNMVYSISKKLILAPEFYWYYYDKDVEDSIMKELIQILPQLFYKKIIIWCQTIHNTKSWMKKFQTYVGTRNELVGFSLYMDTSDNHTSDYQSFYKSNGNSILFCAVKHREGSDIPFLDACLFADKVKNRGIIPFIQSIGRVLRIAPNKTKGVILEGITKTKDYYHDISTKIIDYYCSMYNSSNDNVTRITKLKELLRHLTFHEESKKIFMHISDDDKICIHVEELRWNQIETKIKSNIREKIKTLEIEHKEVLYTHSKILECKINSTLMTQLSYKKAIEHIYTDVINDYDILKLTSGVKKGEEFYGKNGFYKLVLKNGDNICVQLKSANTLMSEIKEKCLKHQISLYMKIRLKDNTIIEINHNPYDTI